MNLKTAIWLLAILVPIFALEFLNTSISDSIGSGDSKILSRRKRFLIFPDGSSFQMVFCTQNSGYIPIGNVVWFGTTAALAWQLPTDPAVFSMLKSSLRDDVLRRNDVNKHIYYLDEVGKVVAKVPYKRKPIVNPAFAKRSVHSKQDQEITITKKAFIKEMHEKQKKRSYLHNLDEASASFHRNGRSGFYKKLEVFFEALGRNGQGCILRMLCEAGKAKEEQGNFLQEILRATFTLPKGASKELLEYDKAHNAGNCAVLYPECDDLHTK